MFRAAMTLACLVTMMSLMPGSARATWQPDGNPVAVPGGDQDFPRLAPDDHGGAFVIWTEGPQGFAQRFTPTGSLAPGWPARGVPVPPYTYSGGHSIAWPGPPASDGAGGVYVVTMVAGPCQAHCSGDPGQLFVERLTPGGTVAPGWPAQAVQLEQALLLRHAIDGTQVVPNGRHGVLVMWSDDVTDRGAGAAPRIAAQAIGPDGALRWGADGLEVASGPGVQPSRAMVSDGEGGAHVFWTELGPDGAMRLLRQHVSSSGRLLLPHAGVPVTARPMTEVSAPLAVSDGHHGAIIAWQGGVAGHEELIASHVPAEGRRDDVHESVLCSAPGGRSAVQMVSAPDGGAIVGWLDSRSGRFLHVYAQRIGPEGRIEWGASGAPVCTVPGVSGGLALAGDGRGGAFFAWSDAREEGRLYAMRLMPHGTRARGWPGEGALVSGWPAGTTHGNSVLLGQWMTATSPGHAILSWMAWQIVASAGYPVAAEQSFVTLLTPDGPAAAGATVPRSLSALPDAIAFRAEAAPHAFALGRVHPNPSASGASVRFALPGASPARLEMFDLAGRRLWSREVGELGPGEHDVRLRGGAWSPPGLYLVRLTQGERTATARVTIVR